LKKVELHAIGDLQKVCEVSEIDSDENHISSEKEKVVGEGDHSAMT
jgi:hypothetical protein